MGQITCNANEGGKYDVIIVGGGPSGCAAAIASAREGKKTLLIERSSALGGMGTMGMVPCWCPYTDQEKIIYKGIAEKIFWRSREYVPHLPEDQLDWVPINAEALKRIYDEEVSGAGAEILFLTQVCDVLHTDGRVEGVLVANKAGLTIYRADVFVDATGDGDIATQSGADYNKGREGNVLQSTTLCFTMANVDTYGYEHVLGNRMNNGDPYAKSKTLVIDDIWQDEEFDYVIDRHFCNNMFAPGAVGFNAGHVEGVDPTDPIQLSKMLLRGRQLVHQFEKGLKKYAPEGFANAWIAQTAPLPGIRESRRIICDYELNVMDYLKRQSFEDEIGRNSYYVDVHKTTKELAEDNEQTYEKYEHYGEGESHGIPYRCLLPKGLTNLLVAGRCIGSDSLMNGSIRVMPTCLVTGEAAGLAAAMAVDTDGDTRAIDVSKLQEKLEGYGAYIHNATK
ncbi:MAG: FAD-dependent oxidoreductase [Faecalimonas sp.]|nr:FAD-dependent oxidoreductase [Faecalimonas sp.]